MILMFFAGNLLLMAFAQQRKPTNFYLCNPATPFLLMGLEVERIESQEGGGLN